MNLIITIIEPPQVAEYSAILKRLQLPLNLELQGRGTALPKQLDLLGLERRPKHVLFSTAGESNTQKLMRAVKRELYIDAPGNGIVVAIPMKSVGGKQTLEFLKGNDDAKTTVPGGGYDNELIMAIANEGYSEQVMEAARGAGARGGTILHAKGTAGGQNSRFYNVTISDEKEIVLIVADKDIKAGIMSAILKQCGPGGEAGTVVFSLPVSDAMGLSGGKAEKAE